MSSGKPADEIYVYICICVSVCVSHGTCMDESCHTYKLGEYNIKTCGCVCKCVHKFTHIYIIVNVYTYIHIHIIVNMYTYIHIYKYMYT